MEFSAGLYIRDLDNSNNLASLNFIDDTLLGIKESPRGLKGFLSSFFGKSHHLWMLVSKSLSEELKNVGFIQIRDCNFNDSKVEMFKYIEDVERFENAVAIKCRK